MALLQCEIDSESLRMDTTVVVILPHDTPRCAGPEAVLYLLHGRGSGALSWIRYTNIELFARKYNLAVIIPEAGRSFYTDMAFGGDYFSYITGELPGLCGRMFGLDHSPGKTYMAGISMGGYGALKCALNYPGRYAAVAAISAVTDINWRIADTPENTPAYRDLQGVFGTEPGAGKMDDLFGLVPAAARSDSKPRLFMACGTEDYREEQNRRLSDLLNKEGFTNTYLRWSGEHNWDFFNPALDKALDFMFCEPGIQRRADIG